MSSYPEKLSQNMPSFDRKNYSKKTISAVALIAFGVLMLGGGVVAQTTGLPDVSIGSNGIDVNTGELDVNSNDVTGVSSMNDVSGDAVLQFNDAQNSVEAQGGFQLPTGTDAYN